jgi:ribosomal protein S18 acetylase RimI-like enzyme
MMEITTRLAESADEKCLVDWLSQKGVLKWFPLTDLREIEDAARIWMSYSKFGAVLTALYNGVPCGIANLYIQPFKKLAHQCLFAIIVDENYRGKGVGTKLLQDLIDLAKNQLGIQILHLEVYEGNPAIGLYKKFGFTEYGKQKHFIKEDGKYLSKVLMQKRL